MCFFVVVYLFVFFLFNSFSAGWRTQFSLKDVKLKINGKRCRVIKKYMVADCMKEEAHCNYIVKHELEIFISLTEWSMHKLFYCFY